MNLDLTKKTELLSLNLTKVGIVDIPVMEVRLAIDKSGSMHQEFNNGLVDRTVDLFLAAGLKFDDNQSLDVGFFNERFHDAPTAVEADAGHYLKKARQSASGGTCYAPIIQNFETKQVKLAATPLEPTKKAGFFSSLFKSAPIEVDDVAGQSEYRAYTGIITDGDNSDKRLFEQELANSSGDTFFQFIAIGTGVHPTYLHDLAAKYDHVAVFVIKNPAACSDEQFYELLCHDKFVKWING